MACALTSALLGTNARAILGSIVLLASAVLPQLASAQAAAPHRSYNITAGTLEDVLNRFGREAGILLSFTSDSTAGLRSPGLQGSYSVADGLETLLNGSGLRASRQPNGSWLLSKRSADAANGSEVLPTVTVLDSATRETATSRLDGYTARRSATGTKTDTSLLETPQSISVIGVREMEDRGVTSLTDALLQTPGVTVNPYGFDSRAPDWVALRGFDGWYSGSYRDGLIQNVGITFLGVQTEIYGLERVEVLRGPSSVLFGKGDAGGIVNRISKVPSADAPREISLQYGSFDRKQIAADIGGKLDDSGQWLYRLVALELDTGSQEKYPNGVAMGQKRHYLAPSLRWQPSARTSLIFQAEMLRDDASDDVQFVTGANGLPTSVKEGDPNYSRIKTGSDSVGYQFEHQLDSGWTIRQKARYAYRQMDKHHILSWLDSDGVTLMRQARHDVESVNDFTIDSSVQGSLAHGVFEHKLLFGVDYTRSRANWNRRSDMAASLNMLQPVYGINIPEPTTLAADTQLTSTQLGWYAQDQISFDQHWRLTLGGRYDSVKSDNNDRFGSARTTQKDSAFSGRAGLSYVVGNGWAPYLSYSESFIPNVGVDVTGKAYTPSEGKQTEAGIKYIPENRPFSFTAALFNLEKTGVVSYDPISFEGRQIGKVRSRGIELETKADLTRQLRLIASLTALDMKVLASANQAEVGKTPILTPQTTASVWLDYALSGAGWHGISVGAGVRYIGKNWNDATNTASTPGYTLVDAALRYDTGPWRFALNASNLFDRRFYVGQAYGSYYRGNERNLLLTARYGF